MRHPRLACMVLGCRRGSTAYPPGQEYLCGPHYRAVDRSLKMLRIRAARRARGRLCVLIWRKMVRQARERAAGL